MGSITESLRIKTNFEELGKVKDISTGSEIKIKCTCTNKESVNVKVLES